MINVKANGIHMSEQTKSDYKSKTYLSLKKRIEMVEEMKAHLVRIEDGYWKYKDNHMNDDVIALKYGTGPRNVGITRLQVFGPLRKGLAAGTLTKPKIARDAKLQSIDERLARLEAKIDKLVTELGS